MVRPRGHDRRSVNNGGHETEPDAQEPDAEHLPTPGMNDNGKPDEELQNDVPADGNLEQFQRLLLLTESVNKLRQQLNADRQARCADPAHTTAVSDDEPDKLLLVNSILPMIPLADTDGTPGENNVPDAHHVPPQAVSNNSTQNNGPSSAQSFWDAARITWEKGGTDRPVDLQNLGLIFPDEAAFENTIEVDWDPLWHCLMRFST